MDSIPTLDFCFTDEEGYENDKSLQYIQIDNSNNIQKFTEVKYYITIYNEAEAVISYNLNIKYSTVPLCGMGNCNNQGDCKKFISWGCKCNNNNYAGKYCELKIKDVQMYQIIT